MRGIVARWLAVVALVATPTFIRYEVTSQPTFACTRDGKFAGTCHAEPTLRQLVVHELNDEDWSRTDTPPRVWFMPVTPMTEIGMVVPSGGEQLLRVRMKHWSSDTVYAIPLADDSSASDERTLAVRFNTFLRDPSKRSFRLRQPGAFHPGFMLFYLAAGLVAFFIVRRVLALRTAAWVAAVEQIPATPITAYRG